VAVLTLFTDDDYVLIPYTTLVASSAYNTAESAGEVKQMLTHYEQDVQASFGHCPVCCHPHPKSALNQHVEDCLRKKETIKQRAELLAREDLAPGPPMSAAVRSKQIDHALEFLAFTLDMRDKRKTLRALKRLSGYILMLPANETRSVYSRPIVIDMAGSADEGGQRRTSNGKSKKIESLDNLLADLLQGTDDGLRDQATKMFNLSDRDDFKSSEDKDLPNMPDEDDSGDDELPPGPEPEPVAAEEDQDYYAYGSDAEPDFGSDSESDFGSA